MKCPFCESEMRKGYIQGARGVLFSEKEKSPFVVKNPFNKKDKTIAGMFSNASPAFYCDNCGTLIWRNNWRTYSGD